MLEDLGRLARRDRLIDRVIQPTMVNDAELERGGRLLGVTSDDLGHRLDKEPAQRGPLRPSPVDRADSISFALTTRTLLTCPRQRQRKPAVLMGRRTSHHRGLGEVQVSHNACRSIVPPCGTTGLGVSPKSALEVTMTAGAHEQVVPRVIGATQSVPGQCPHGPRPHMLPKSFAQFGGWFEGNL